MLQDHIRPRDGDSNSARRNAGQIPGPRQLIISRQQLEEFEIGSLLQALLLFPTTSEWETVPLVADALAAKFLASTPHLRASWSEGSPHLLALDDREVARVLRTMDRRSRDRMVAARMALGFLKEGLTGTPAVLPKSMGGKHTIDALSELVLRQSGESSSENVRKRAWLQTRSVLNLAAAFQIVLRLRGGDDQLVGMPLDDPALNNSIVCFAQIHETLIRADTRFAHWSHSLVHIEITD